ncbi:hypothetical protein C5C31_13995 [Rathayibacter rathayi]|uniref:Uncharacterized protein n=2 Tax=Rathayibacter rathayi TaxID=33887 RepID=A0ABD6W564_RATRA|nr:hypothetical protein C1O28_10525 [Rathayibacter rathayi]PPF10187.1 hypothetical protein C5C04_13660 [Rathayibacter rathayi]PPF20079.1 hypothetical protein C5C34_14620 [Rathayibacter rathayi]PPF42986.1 hypothetical protein C5C08_14520 [Rathayibacter rathayi]PPF77653.1 hypothetical protein C5C14_12195 [Rathayibacter rathayi]
MIGGLRDLDVGTAWWAGLLDQGVRNVEERMDGRNDEGCPRWCAGEHDEMVAVGERLHRSVARSLPAVLWAGGGGAAAGTVHLSLCRPGASGEDRLRLEADGIGEVDLDLSAGARLAGAVLRLLEAL